MGEQRYRWTVNEDFPAGAYDNLVEGGVFGRGESTKE